MALGRKRQCQLDKAERARNAKAALNAIPNTISISSDGDSDILICHWDGSVNHVVSSESEDDSEYINNCWESGSDWDNNKILEDNAMKVIEKLSELAGERERQIEHWRKEAAVELEHLEKELPYDEISKGVGKKRWKSAEKHLNTGVHTRSSVRTKQRHKQQA
ncbi:hypothetical protein C8J55DRAFT_562351 [Lentinula edodes]|uniref:Uncharacterized protein n=1 Tax=Lentinula lateritia TaxID=40482 RepID=A0A9W9A683_9AGAR|nr:hypothetical protein C8J55DRAFT_562351 [Lentinula edodes]